MPDYVFSNADRSLVETRTYSMAEVPESIEVNGQTLLRDYGLQITGGHLPGAWPMTSDALALASDEQVAEARMEAGKAGVRAEFTPDGRPIFESRGHRAAYCKALGYVDRDGGYSDHTYGANRREI